MSSQEQRRADRGSELYRRAEKIKEAEKRRKESVKRKHEKEQREREARRRMGIASQKPYFSQHQLRLESFVRTKGAEGSDSTGSATLSTENKDDRDDVQEPWVEDDIDDGLLLQSLSMPRLSIPKPETEFVTARSIINPEDHSNRDKLAKETFKSPLDNNCDWNDFLISNTQIERDISSPSTRTAAMESSYVDPFLELLSTQDVNFSFDDMEEPSCNPPQKQQQQPPPLSIPRPSKELSERERDAILMPPPQLPRPRKAPAIPVIQNTEVFDLFSLDFNLSTQDCREIG